MGARFSKIREFLYQKAFSIGEKSELGGKGGQKWLKNIGYHLWMAPKTNINAQLEENLNHAEIFCNEQLLKQNTQLVLIAIISFHT